MTFKKIDFLINEQQTINHALKKINKNGQRCLVVVDNKKRLIGTIGDSDIRRSLLKNKNISNKIKNVFNSNPFYLLKDSVNLSTIKKILVEKKLDIIPILNKDKTINDIFFLDRFEKNTEKLNNSVVIMAGGRGTRMAPFTHVLPKMLLPINDKTVIEHILDRFIKNGLEKFFICINHKADIVRSYFSNKKKYKIIYSEEKNPLGTVGGIRLIKHKFKEDFLVINCDVIFDIDFFDLLSYHKKNKNKLTIVAAKKIFNIPYGVCKVSNNNMNLLSITEKPSLDILVNTGLYVFSPSLINKIPRNLKFDFDNLIEKLKKDKFKVGVYAIDDSNWKDTGQWNEFSIAEKAIKI